jgi:hypothetical protein
LIQSSDGWRRGDYDAKVFPLAFGREVIGCSFPVYSDPAQFLNKLLWGRRIEAWLPSELRVALHNWGIAWVFTITEEAHSLLAKTVGHSGEIVGKYRAFQISRSPGRFLVGAGHLRAKVNRIVLKELRSENGIVVIRYRYHPAWQTNNNIPVYQYPVPEDPMGFIALENPPKSVTLRFDPWKMLVAPWPKKISTDIAAEAARLERVASKSIFQ